jgi:hypothetical protein
VERKRRPGMEVELDGGCAWRRHWGLSMTKRSGGGGGGGGGSGVVSTWAYFFIFSCKKKEWLIIEVITLLDHVNNF